LNSVGKVSRIVKSLTSTTPLWLLGFSRLLSVKGTGYHEHVTEYGVHWNFFFTIAIIRVSFLLCIHNTDMKWLERGSWYRRTTYSPSSCYSCDVFQLWYCFDIQLVTNILRLRLVMLLVSAMISTIVICSHS